MNNKLMLGVLIFLFVIGMASFVRLNKTNSTITSNVIKENISQSGNNNVEIKASNVIDKNKLSSHNCESDCWVAYDGKVYDITSWLPIHPGSAGAISPYCGTSDEFTGAFEKKHGTSKVKNLMKVGVLIGDFEVKGNLV